MYTCAIKLTSSVKNSTIWYIKSSIVLIPACYVKIQLPALATVLVLYLAVLAALNDEAAYISQ